MHANQPHFLLKLERVEELIHSHMSVPHESLAVASLTTAQTVVWQKDDSIFADWLQLLP
jgi:hypothetical protein